MCEERTGSGAEAPAEIQLPAGVSVAAAGYTSH